MGSREGPDETVKKFLRSRTKSGIIVKPFSLWMYNSVSGREYIWRIQDHIRAIDDTICLVGRPCDESIPHADLIRVGIRIISKAGIE